MRLLPSIFIAYVASFCVAADLRAADEYLQLAAEAKRMHAPKKTPPPSLANMHSLAISDSVWNINKTELSHSTSAIRQAIDLELAPSQVRLMLAAVSKNVIQAQIVNDDNDYGLVSFRHASYRPQVLANRRTHLERIHVLPEVRSTVWQEMRREISADQQQPDYFAGHHFSEYCAADVGVGIPHSASSHLSILDMAKVESTSSSLELSLLHLLEQPDIFRESSDLNDPDDEEVEEQPWRIVTRAWVDAGPRRAKLKDLSTWWNAQKLSQDPDATSFAKELSESAVQMRKNCAEKSGEWHEGERDRGTGRFLIYACRGSKASMSYALSMDDDEELVEGATLDWDVMSGGYRSQLSLEEGHSDLVFSLNILRGEKPISTTLLYDAKGNPRGVLGAPEDPQHFVWDDQGRVIWSGSFRPNQNWLEDISWSVNGTPSAMLSFQDNGDISRLVEWTETGAPTRYLKFERGKPDGLESWWHSTGQNAGEIMWYAGKKFGSTRVRFENGVTAFDASYVDDKLDGPLMWRDELARDVLTARFKMGYADQLFKISNGEGLVLATATFDGGRAEGNVVIGDSAKQRPTATLPFKSGLLDGNVVFADRVGTTRMIVPFRSGKLQGHVQGFYRQDKPAIACDFEDGHILSWQVWSYKAGVTELEIAGKVTDRFKGTAEMSASNGANDIKVSCLAGEDTWQKCQWSIRGKNQQLNQRMIRLGDSEGGRLKPCGIKSIEWDLSRWFEAGSTLVEIDVTPAKKCAVSRQRFRCDVKLSEDLPVSGCEAILEDDEHHHEF